MNFFKPQLMPTLRLLIVAAALASMATASSLSAGTIFESGTLGPTGIFADDIGGGTAPGGAIISDFAFNGVRFEITQSVVTSRIGGHFVLDSSTADSFFGAIVQLDDATDFPDSGDLSTPDILGSAILTFPNPSAEVFSDLILQLDAGWYALVFGSGLFGATGEGGALLNNPDIGAPSYIAHQTGVGWVDLSTIPGPFKNYRLVVTGFVVPEPSSAVIVLMATTLLISMRWTANNSY